MQLLMCVYRMQMATDTTELVKVFNNLVNQDQSAGENTLTLAALEKSFAVSAYAASTIGLGKSFECFGVGCEAAPHEF